MKLNYSLAFAGLFISDYSHKIVKPGCGWIHIPPNAQANYEYQNSNSILSDCENWRPDGSGAKDHVSCSNWGCGSDAQAQFILWWMQNLPGQNNGLLLNGQQVRNWWEFAIDFDAAVAKGKKLTE